MEKHSDIAEEDDQTISSITIHPSNDGFEFVVAELRNRICRPTTELADSVPALEEMGRQAGVAQLAGYLIRQYADRVKIREKNGLCRAQLHFEH